MNVLNTIKAINERLATYERQGLTQSANYQKMIERIQLEGLPTTTSKNGTIRISRSKENLLDINTESLGRVKVLPSLVQERAQLKSRGIKDKESQDYNIISYGKLKQWADENLQELYNDARQGLENSEILEEMFDDGMRNYDYDYIFSMIERYEQAKKKRDSIFEESSYFIGD